VHTYSRATCDSSLMVRGGKPLANANALSHTDGLSLCAHYCQAQLNAHSQHALFKPSAHLCQSAAALKAATRTRACTQITSRVHHTHYTLHTVYTAHLHWLAVCAHTHWRCCDVSSKRAHCAVSSARRRACAHRRVRHHIHTVRMRT
jgi:hypothetical protein